MPALEVDVENIKIRPVDAPFLGWLRFLEIHEAEFKAADIDPLGVEDGTSLLFFLLLLFRRDYPLEVGSGGVGGEDE